MRELFAEPIKDFWEDAADPNHVCLCVSLCVCLFVCVCVCVYLAPETKARLMDVISFMRSSRHLRLPRCWPTDWV